MRIENIVLPYKNPDQRFNIEFTESKIQHVTALTDHPSPPPSLILPALCHPHIHLDKAYLLTSHPKPSNNDDYPDYSDLGLESGDFKEALSKTSQAKTRYTIPDLILRGSQLIAESIRAGVTSIRAFVEIDHVTQFKCIDAAVQLKQKFSSMCYIQICAFAQDPIMSTEHGDENRRLMVQALDKYAGEIEVLGTTPYVEESTLASADNVEWAIEVAITRKLHLDFHLDYNLSSTTNALIWDVVNMLKKAQWTEKASEDKRIVFGHCSRMTLFSKEDMSRLAREVAGLPVAFVGLPTSDLFMMGRPGDNTDGYGRRERGTLQVIDMIQKNGLQACIGVNNTGNAFTPWGSVDPLRLASLGVGLYHAGTSEHAQILYECVSTRARHAIGLQQRNDKGSGEDSNSFDLTDCDTKDILIISNEQTINCIGLHEVVPARQRLTVTDVVWDPPELRLRRLLCCGK